MPSIQVPDVSGRRVVSGFITAAAVLAAVAFVDTFVPGPSFIPGFLAPFAKLTIAFGAGAFIYRQIKE